MLLLGGHNHCVKVLSDSETVRGMGLWEFSGALRELMLNLSFLGGSFCLITFANSLDPDQDQQNIDPDLFQTSLTVRKCLKKSADDNISMQRTKVDWYMLLVPFLIEFFKKLIQFFECSWNHEYFGSLAKYVKPEGLRASRDPKYSRFHEHTKK